jgi:hypothetical protein
MNRKAVLPLLVFSLSAITVTSAAVNVAVPTNRCILPKGLFPKLPPGFKDPRAELFCNQQKRSVAPRGVTKKAPRLSPTPVWIRQLGTEDDGISSSAGNIVIGPQDNIYITGSNWPEVYDSGSNALVAKYSPQGKLLWEKQVNNDFDDYINDIAVDSRGNIFIIGVSQSPGPSSFGFFLFKYSSQGQLLWKKRLGDFRGDDFRGEDVAVDSGGNVFATGNILKNGTYDSDNLSIVKYSPQGKVLWKKKLLDRNDYSTFQSEIEIDSHGNVFITAEKTETGKTDAFIVKYSPQGKLLWKNQFDPIDVYSSSRIAFNSRNDVFVTGSTYAQPDDQGYAKSDVWIAKYSSEGKLLWKKQLGTAERDASFDIAVDRRGDVFITGLTYGQLGAQSYGESDAWIAKYSHQGKLLSTVQFGTAAKDASLDIATNSRGDVFVAGYINLRLTAEYFGYYKATGFVAKYRP